MVLLADIPQQPSPAKQEVYFIASHPASGSHFADFYFVLLQNEHIKCTVLASEKAAEELEKRGVPTYNFYDSKKVKPLKDLTQSEQKELASSVAQMCQHAQCVITDLGQEFSGVVHSELQEHFPTIKRIAYYDNPEAFVPGGYSTTARKVMKKANAILFANSKLAQAPIYTAPNKADPVDLSDKQRIGLGYANMGDIEDLQALRKSDTRLLTKESFCKHNGLETRSTLGVYFGGANEVYYNEAFPRFLSILTESSKQNDLSALNIVIQQHPRSVLEGNRDGKLLEEWKKTAPAGAPQVTISTAPFNDALIAADLALYYQTGAANKFVLVGIPTAQIGHEPFQDILVRNHFCPSVTNAKGFLEVLEDLKKHTSPSPTVQKSVAEESGFDPQWPDNLLRALNEEHRQGDV